MTVSIRLMSDWGSYPFYVDEGDGFFGHLDPTTFQSRFHLPDDVVRAVLDWDAGYQALIDWNDPGGSGWQSRDDEIRFIELGRSAASQLRLHVPSEVRIVYTGADNVAPEHY